MTHAVRPTTKNRCRKFATDVTRTDGLESTASRRSANPDAGRAQLNNPVLVNAAFHPFLQEQRQSQQSSAEMADKKPESQFYTRPPTLGAWESFRIFLWNSETNQFLGRTGGSWGKFQDFV